MKKFHPFFTIGTFGIIITAILHIVLALGLSVVTNHTAFFVIYPSFIAFMIIGIALTMKNQKEAKTD
ncbi:MAG: hypothetical protein PHY26_04060 [Bacilli bacterium]|nr:hypothetical protein [Bacilli bacterium]